MKKNILHKLLIISLTAYVIVFCYAFITSPSYFSFNSPSNSSDSIEPSIDLSNSNISESPSEENSIEPSLIPSIDFSVEPTIEPTVEPSVTEPTIIPSTSEEVKDEPLEMYKELVINDRINQIYENAFFDDKNSEIYNLFSIECSNAINKINNANSYEEINQIYEDTLLNINEIVPVANGIYNFGEKDLYEAFKALENYLSLNNANKINIADGYVYYGFTNRVNLGSETYIPNYGFGLLEEGSVESNDEFGNCFNVLIDEKNLSSLFIDKELLKLVSSSYYKKFMNNEKNGYQYVNELADSEILYENYYSDTWKVKVKTNEIKYSTLSTSPEISAYNNKTVSLQDYETIFKLVLTQKFNNDYFSAHDLISLGLVGAKNYYQQSTQGYDDALWEEVGINTYEENGSSFIEFKFENKISYPYFFTYMNLGNFAPIPQSFLDLIGPENFMKYDLEKENSLVDNYLSVGPYTYAKSNKNEILLKKNENYIYKDSKYQIKEICIKSNENESTYSDYYDPYLLKTNNDQSIIKHVVPDNSKFNINVNSTTQKQWEEFFGENGKILKTNKEDYWEVEPALSNDFFIKGINEAINKTDFCNNIENLIPCNSIFQFDLETSFNKGSSYIQETNRYNFAYSFDIEKARQYFAVAMYELENQGKYTPGTIDNPTIIDIEITWMYESQLEYHNLIKAYLEEAFNDISVTQGKYKLNVSYYIPENWTDVFYNKFYCGKFDLGYGVMTTSTISSSNPLYSLYLLSSSSNLSDGFTVNWSKDSNENPSIIYNGKRYTYDALLVALGKDVIVEDGKLKEAFKANLIENIKTQQNTYETTIEIDIANIEELSYKIKDVVLFNADYNTEDYFEESILSNCIIIENTEEGKITITISHDQALVNKYIGKMGIDIYYEVYQNETLYEKGYKSLYSVFS